MAALFYFPLPAPTYYWDLSENLLKDHTFGFEGGTTTYMEPLYSVFLAGARLISGDRPWLVMLIQITVAAAGAVFLFQVTRTMTGSVRAATIASLFYSFDPYFVRQSVSYLEIPLLVTLLLWALRHVPSARANGDARSPLLGVLLGALWLTRASLLPVYVAAVVLVALRRGWRRALLVSAAALLVAAPWIVRSYRLDGSLLPSRVGENLYVSTSQYAIGVLPEHDVDLLVPFAHALVDRELGHLPPEQLGALSDRLLRDRAIEFARSHPRETVALKLRNLFFVFWPGILPVEPKSERVQAVFDGSRVRIVGAERRPRLWEGLHVGARSVLLVAAVVGIAVRRRQWRDDAMLYVVLFSVAAIHVVFFPTTRLLAPMTGVLMTFAGAGVAWLIRRSEDRHNPGSKP